MINKFYKKPIPKKGVDLSAKKLKEFAEDEKLSITQFKKRFGIK